MPRKINASLLQRRLDIGEQVLVNGQLKVIASLMSVQKAIKSQTKDVREKKADPVFQGYEKPEITVYGLHHGKVLINTQKNIGTNYKVIA